MGGSAWPSYGTPLEETDVKFNFKKRPPRSAAGGGSPALRAALGMGGDTGRGSGNSANEGEPTVAARATRAAQNAGGVSALRAGRNPYLDARREWDERYGDVLARAHSWRLVALAAIAVSAIAVLGAVHIASQSKIEPYVVALNTLGDPLVPVPATSGAAVTRRILTWQVAEWIYNARSVLADRTAEQNIIKGRVFSMASKSVASYLNAWYSAHPPYGHPVRVRITSVLPISVNTFQVNWQESTDADGIRSKTDWQANVVTGVDPKLVSSGNEFLNNPLGIFVKDLSWTQVYQ